MSHIGGESMDKKTSDNTFEKILKSLQLNKNISETIKIIEEMEENEKTKLFSYIIDNDPFSLKKNIDEIVPLMFLEDDESVINLCELLKKTSRDMAFTQILEPLEKYAEDNPNLAFTISEKMLKYEKMEGACSGFILSTLIGKKIIDDRIIKNIESDDGIKQNQAYVSLRYAIYQKKDDMIQDIIKQALILALNKGLRNKGILIEFLVAAYNYDEKIVEEVILKEFSDVGFVRNFIYNSQYNENISIDIYKQAIEVLEKEVQNLETIDEALSRIYKKDPKYVVKKVLDRINKGEIPFVSDQLAYIIHNTDIDPIIEMMEEEIENDNYRVKVFGINLLFRLIPKNIELVKLCNKWKKDGNKRNIVIDIIGRILSRNMNFEYSEEREEAIIILKELIKKEGLDYDERCKDVDLGKNKRDANGYLQETMRALAVIKSLEKTSIPFVTDEKNIKKNISRYDNIKRVFDEKWLIDNSKKEKVHLITILLGADISDDDFQKFSDGQLKDIDDQVLGILKALNYIEKILEALNKNRISFKSNKFKNPDQYVSTLSELEVMARLSKSFTVTPEPKNRKLGGTKLDLLIEWNGEKAIIEIATVDEPMQLKLSHNATIGVPGGKVKKVLLSKYKKQLKNGMVDPEIPIIFLLNIDGLLPLDHEVLNAIYGEFVWAWGMNTETMDVASEGSQRKQNSFFDEPNSDIVNYIGSYRRTGNFEIPFNGKLYHPPSGIEAKNPLTKDFVKRLRETLFGIREADYISLTKIRGIDKRKAKKLFHNGIEDLGILASDDLTKYCIPGISSTELEEFQREAKRLIHIYQTGRVDFLRIVDEEIVKVLHENNILLIKQIYEVKKPKGIKYSTWRKIKNEAKKYI